MVSDGGKDGGTKPLAYQINFSVKPEAQTAEVEFANFTTEQQVAVYDGARWQIVTDLQAVPLGDGYFYALLEPAAN
jgi:hypothetical protein